MSQVQSVSGRAIPLVGNDIDTDRIIPARFLRCITFDGLGAQVFADDRSQLNGQHAFDQPQYQGAEILVVNRNFGCGSSREHAPQAIAKWGIKALVGESFAEIFFGNCVAMGVPCVTAASADLQALQDWIAAHPCRGAHARFSGNAGAVWYIQPSSGDGRRCAEHVFGRHLGRLRAVGGSGRSNSADGGQTSLCELESMS